MIVDVIQWIMVDFLNVKNLQTMQFVTMVTRIYKPKHEY